MLGIIVLPLSIMVTCKETRAVIIALNKKGFTDKNICTHIEAKTFGGWPGVKKGSKEATSLQENHQGQTDILQKVQ